MHTAWQINLTGGLISIERTEHAAFFFLASHLFTNPTAPGRSRVKAGNTGMGACASNAFHPSSCRTCSCGSFGCAGWRSVSTEGWNCAVWLLSTCAECVTTTVSSATPAPPALLTIAACDGSPKQRFLNVCAHIHKGSFVTVVGHEVREVSQRD